MKSLWIELDQLMQVEPGRSVDDAKLFILNFVHEKLEQKHTRKITFHWFIVSFLLSTQAYCIPKFKKRKIILLIQKN